VLLLSQQPAIPARSAIGSSDGTIILSLWFGNLLASELARRKSSSATSVPEAHRNRTAFALRTPSSAARDSDLRRIWQPDRRELPSEGVYRLEMIKLDVGRSEAAAKASLQSQNDLYHLNGIQLFGKRRRAAQIRSGFEEWTDDINYECLVIVCHSYFDPIFL
jgi:hypothetical protein